MSSSSFVFFFGGGRLFRFNLTISLSLSPDCIRIDCNLSKWFYAFLQLPIFECLDLTVMCTFSTSLPALPLPSCHRRDSYVVVSSCSFLHPFLNLNIYNLTYFQLNYYFCVILPSVKFKMCFPSPFDFEK